MFTFPTSHWSTVVQKITISNVNNLILSTYGPFAALKKGVPIEVTLTGNFYASTTAGYGVDLGNLSTWFKVDITLASGGVIGGDGGNGGSSSNGTGGAGGTGLRLNSTNSPSIVSFTNSGTIRGGGGGGGGGVRSSQLTAYNTGAKTANCSADGTAFAGGGGGGGGRTHLNNSTGGGSTTSTVGPLGGCSISSNGSVGSAGTTGGGGGGGLRGASRYRSDPGTVCGACTLFFGGAGGAGGSWGAVGFNGTSGARGAAGFSAINTGSVDWTDNGTLNGPTT
jgi:hypothetical protein